MLLRALFALIALSGAAFAGFVADAATATSQALRLTQLAQSADLTQTVRDSILGSARNTLATAWSRPLLWHAGALEAHSGSAFLQAQLEHRGDLRRTSAQSALQAVHLSPIQPTAWFRLALLDYLGVENGECGVAECLANSWRAARMSDPRLACERLQLAAAAGLPIAERDERIAWYAAARPPRSDIAQCLRGFPPDSLFYALLTQREATARAHGE